jgi:hypothetical protein
LTALEEAHVNPDAQRLVMRHCQREGLREFGDGAKPPRLAVLIAAGYVADVTDTVQPITGKPPRTFAAFAREHAGVWA